MRHVLSLATILVLGAALCPAQSQNPGATMPQSSTPDTPAASQTGDAGSSDQALDTRLHQQFDSIAAFKNVQIAVSNGKVELSGTVPSNEDKKRAKEMAGSVPGVRGVRERLTVATDTATPSAPAGTAGGVAGATTGSTAIKESSQNTAGSIAGNSASTSAASPAQQASGQAGIAGGATGAATDKSGSTANTGAMGAPTAGAAGQAGVATASTDSSALHSQLDSAFQSDPSLSTSHIVVNVTDTSIELTGSVPTVKERLTAKRIAQSYAGNRKVDEKLTVSGTGGGRASENMPASGSTAGTDPKSTGTTPTVKDPSMNPPNDNQQTAPAANNPKTQGDQSTSSPR